MVLLICRAWSLRPWVLELLGGALKLLMLLRLVLLLLRLVLLLLLLLAITPCRASWTNVAPGLSWSGGLPLQLPQLSAHGHQGDGLV
jgi:hypothetical protein